MLLPDVFFAFILALVLSFVFALLIRKSMPRKGFFWFFLVIFLATWAGGVWGKPYGAPLGGRNWLAFPAAGMLASLLLTILAPRAPKLDRHATLDRHETMDMLEKVKRREDFIELAYISINVFFWLIVLILLVMIIARYL